MQLRNNLRAPQCDEPEQALSGPPRPSLQALPTPLLGLVEIKSARPPFTEVFAYLAFRIIAGHCVTPIPNEFQAGCCMPHALAEALTTSKQMDTTI